MTPGEMKAAVDAVLDSGASTPDDAQAGAASARTPPSATGEPRPFEQPELGVSAGEQKLATIELLDDVELNVKIELGRTEMYIEDVLRLGVGSVVELNRSAGDPVDILVNDRLVARGEVLVLNDNFCVRINEIISPVPEFATES
ncbi:MAG: flagellar motor switch protein FliN [Phycisphaerae bacterium]|nr:flagellar motor switch protein FliN [Phycisphaerae bacterium]NUQ50861.1 flagellar motor switch protein FliN [Phycisphaerae bacterium]